MCSSIYIEVQVQKAPDMETMRLLLPHAAPRTNSPPPSLSRLPVALKMRKFEKSKRKGRNNCHRRYPLPSTSPLKKIIRIVIDLLLTGEMTKIFCFQVSSISILNPRKGDKFEMPSLDGPFSTLVLEWKERCPRAAACRAAISLVCQSFSGGGGVQISRGADDHAFPDKME